MLQMAISKTLDIMIEKKIRIKDSDVIHALIRKHLKDLSANDVLEYRKVYLGKDD